MNEHQREVLLRAARIIDEKGWTVGQLERTRPDDTGIPAGVCMVGAVATALGIPLRRRFVENDAYAYEKVDVFLEKHERFYDGSPDWGAMTRADVMYHWNDSLFCPSNTPPVHADDLIRARERVQTALRRLAEGASWVEAVASEEVKVATEDQAGGEEAPATPDPVPVTV